jgi:cytochrome c oxidase subunit IV
MEMNYEAGKKLVTFGFWLLTAITALEIGIALLGNGHLIHGFTLPKWIMYPVMIGLSLYKAYFIVYNFMHMAHEVKGLAMSVLLPMLLLVWAIIAFFSEGNFWHTQRSKVENVESPAKPVQKTTGMLELKPVESLKTN